MSICAIIPAAGKGSRLNSARPKIFTEIIPGKTIWDILYEKIRPHVDQINLVLNSEVENDFNDFVVRDATFTSNQDIPVGMGDAIFKGYETWKKFDYVLIVWGDQVHVSNNTISDVLKKTSSKKDNHLILPISVQDDPYVEYIFNSSRTELKNIKQSREGDKCSPGGFSDIGVFCLSTKNIKHYWDEYLNCFEKGTSTGEINFLPFLILLSENNWEMDTVLIEDNTEARGVNTPDDLAYFQKIYENNR